jgi:hypothetical protein
MRKLYWILLLCTLLPLLGGCPSMADRAITEFSVADLHGMIYDYHSQPCSQVRILIDNRDGPLSDINGRFVLKNLSKGTHSIALIKDGYEEVSFSFDFINRTQVLYVKLFSLNQLLELAEKELDNKKLGKAEELLSRAEKIDAENVVLLYMKAILALKREQVEQALTLLNSILEQGIIEPMVLLTMADIYEYYKKDTQKAIYYLNRYLHQEENPDARKRLKKLEQDSKKPAATAVPDKPAEPVKPGEPTQPPDKSEPAATPVPTITQEPTATPFPTSKPEPAVTPGPGQTPEPTATPGPTATPEPTTTPGPGETPEPTATPGPTATPEPSATPSPSELPDVMKPLMPFRPPGNGSAGQ